MYSSETIRKACVTWCYVPDQPYAYLEPGALAAMSNVYQGCCASKHASSVHSANRGEQVWPKMEWATGTGTVMPVMLKLMTTAFALVEEMCRL